jgi:hypothetical protein
MVGLERDRLVSKLGDVWNGLYCLANRQELCDSKRLIERCQALGIAHEYFGGCYAVNHEENRDIYEPSLSHHRIQSRYITIREA